MKDGTWYVGDTYGRTAMSKSLVLLSQALQSNTEVV